MAASALRDAGLHPVVLGHDPLAQLLQPGHAARLLVPEEELSAARELLQILEPPEVRMRGVARELGATGWALAFILAAAVSPGMVPLLVAVAAVSWLLLRRARSRALAPAPPPARAPAKPGAADREPGP